MEAPASLDRFSLNTITIKQWSLPQAVAACASAGVGWIAPWRDKVAEIGAPQASRMIADQGLRVSSLCRGGFFPARPDEIRSRWEDNCRAVEEAAQLGAPVLVLVCGSPLDGDLPAARAAIASGIERLVPYAKEHGVRLGIEPLHPLFVAERSAIVTLGEALDLAVLFDEETVGVVVDAYHVFWDRAITRELGRAGQRVIGFHVSDWITPTGDVLASRGLMGDGIIDLRGLRGQVEATGYTGPIEVEVISEALWELPGADVLRSLLARYQESV